MTNIHQLPSEDERYDAASLWIEKLDAGLSPDETSELQQWMAADPANKAVFFKMAGLWDKMDSLGRLSALFPEPTAKKRSLTWRRSAIPIAVSTLLVIAAGWAVLTFEEFTLFDEPVAVTTAAEESVYETAVGEHATVTLTDGTELVLNTNSRIRVKFAPDHRLLILDAGEVHVQVAEDASRPLSVVAGVNIVQALGTAFNVEITSDKRIELVVTEGKVRVGVRPDTPDLDELGTPKILPSSSVTVTAGEELVLGTPSEDITRITEADIEVKLSWRTGNLIFRGEPLEEAVAEVGRYTAVEFVIVDDDLKTIGIAGRFKAGDVDGLLAVLRENFDIRYERVDEQKVLLSRR